MFDSTSGVRLHPELVSASRQVEIDFMNRLEVYRKRPRRLGNGQGHSRHSDEAGAGTQRGQERSHQWDRSSA